MKQSVDGSMSIKNHARQQHQRQAGFQIDSVVLVTVMLAT